MEDLIKELVKKALIDNLEINLDTFFSDDRKFLEVQLKLFGEVISTSHIATAILK